MFIAALSAAALFTACEKENASGNMNERPEPGGGKEYTLNFEKGFICLNYLQRDTIRIVNSGGADVGREIDMENVQWSIVEGDSCISMIGNVVVGRRVGRATLLAQYNGEYGTVTVGVESEEYIPVERVVFEINGERHCTGDTLYFPTFERAGLKWIGFELQNASMPRVSSSLLWSTLSNGEGSIANDQEWMLKQQGIDTATTRLWGFISELDGFEFLVHPTIAHGLWTDSVNPSDSDDKIFIPNDSIPSWVFDVCFEVWPKDLVRSEWDNQQLRLHFSSETLKEYTPVYRKQICFADLDNRISIESEDKHPHSGNARIYIRAGETKQLKANLFAPQGWESYVTWEDPNKESNNSYKLQLSQEGLLVLPSDFNTDYLKGLGYSEKELAADTVYIGNVNAYLMKEPFKSQWLERYSYIIWNSPNVKTLKSNTASVFWVKSVCIQKEGAV